MKVGGVPVPLVVALVAAGFGSFLGPAAARGQNAPPAMRQVAPDLYFHVDQTASNSIIWVTADGVLVVDTKQHPRQAQALLREIRSLTDKPIKWAFVTQAHGDHFLGNQILREAGASIVSHSDVPRLMERYIDKELARRQRFFASNNYDPKEISLIYLGASQDPGYAFVYFPHAKALARPRRHRHEAERGGDDRLGPAHLDALYHLLTTGKSIYLDRD